MARSRTSTGSESSVIGIRDLSRSTGALVDEILTTGRPKIVTRSGQPAVIIQAIDQDQLVEVLVSRSREFTKEREQGRKDIREGRVFSQAQVERERRRKSGGASASTRRRAAGAAGAKETIRKTVDKAKTDAVAERARRKSASSSSKSTRKAAARRKTT